MLPWKKRWEEVKQQVKELLGSNCLHCEMSSSDPELRGLDILPPPAKVTKDLFFEESSPFDQGRGRVHNTRSAEIDVKYDIQSPLHTLLQVTCKKRKGLVYDTLRCVKDMRLQVAHMRISSLENGNSEISVFFLDPKGQRIEDRTKQNEICACVREAVENPLRIKIVTRGDDTELFVSTPIESCGRGRPRVVYDVTLALRKLDICIFQVNNFSNNSPTISINTSTLCFFTAECHISEGRQVVKVLVVKTSQYSNNSFTSCFIPPGCCVSEGRKVVKIVGFLVSFGCNSFGAGLQADINRHHVNDQQWEVYRFLLSEKEDFCLKSTRNRNLIIDRVQEVLIG